MININKLELTEKEQNILNILNAILSSKEIAPNDIAQQTGLSPSTLSRVLNQLKKKRIIVDIGKENTEKGRRPGLVSFNNNYGHLLHFNITHDSITGYIANIGGTVYDRYQAFFKNDNSLEDVSDVLSSVYKKLAKKNFSLKTRILASGISLPGVVNEKDRLVQRIPDVFSFNDIDVFDYAEKLLKTPVIVNNVSRLGAIGQHIGSYPENNNIVYLEITNSIGIGAGVLINGELLKGSNYYAGEVGYLYFDLKNFSDDPKENIGCLENYAGLKVFYEKISDVMNRGGANILRGLMAEEKASKLSLRLIERAAEQGDKDVINILENVLKVWSIAIININLLINPDLIVIGGAISPENTYILNRIQDMVSRDRFFKPEIRISQLGDKAQLIGGIYLLQQYVYNNIVAKEAIR